MAWFLRNSFHDTELKQYKVSVFPKWNSTRMDLVLYNGTDNIIYSELYQSLQVSVLWYQHDT